MKNKYSVNVKQSGYSNYIELHGWLNVDLGLEYDVSIDVIEIASGLKNEVRMFLNFTGEDKEFSEKVRNIIPTFTSMDDGETFEISDENLISELFLEYGNNGKISKLDC